MNCDPESVACRRAKLPPGGRIFGIGLSRTGTTSLTFALEMLGYRSVHFPTDPRSRTEIMRALRNSPASLRLSILDDVDAVTDTPVCATFPALDAAYPGSRFLYTVRDKEEWLKSCERFWATVLEPYCRANPADATVAYVTTVCDRIYGGIEFDRVRFAGAFDDYEAQVTTYFRDRPNDLLTIDICGGEGWPPLSRFLGAPAPRGRFPARSLPPGMTGLPRRG